MPYKSDSQRRFFHYAESIGQMPKKTVEEFDKASKGKKLPEKLNPFKKLKDLMKKRV